jgi:hypothetical protein
LGFAKNPSEKSESSFIIKKLDEFGIFLSSLIQEIRLAKKKIKKAVDNYREKQLHERQKNYIIKKYSF